ncbi:MAG: DUF3617 domain-containing protein [Rubrivivax sp.]
MLELRTLVIAAGLAGLCSAALAQKIAPGLWESQGEASMPDNPELQAKMKQAQAQMANLPPEQRKMVEQMMAKQGVQMGSAGAKPTFRYCVSKEQAERNQIQPDAEGRCKQDSVERSGNTLRFKVSCSNPPSTGSGEITFISDKAYTMKMTVDATAAKGQVGRMEMNSSAKWIAADCGSVKPRP